jgi:hypothetical protein
MFEAIRKFKPSSRVKTIQFMLLIIRAWNVTTAKPTSGILLSRAGLPKLDGKRTVE